MRAHGSNGTFLSSLAALSILSITSHHHGHRSQNTLILHHSRSAARLTPAPRHHHLSNHDHGTRVSVQDLFGNIPVRVKQRAMVCSDGRDDAKEWDVLKRCIVGLLLAWDSATAISIRDVAVTKKLHIRDVARAAYSLDNDAMASRKASSFDLRIIASILFQAAYVEQPSQDTWVRTSARTLHMTIRGAFSLVPAPTKHVQFISLSIRPLNPENNRNILYDEINRIFSASSFGVLEDLPDADERGSDRRSKDRRYKQDGFTNKQLKGGGKGVDRWPMFYIRVELQDTSKMQYRSEDSFLEGGSMLSSIMEVLGAMTTGFLKEYHFRPRARPLKKQPTGSEDHTSSSSRPRSRFILKQSPPNPTIPSRDADEVTELVTRNHSRPSVHFAEPDAESTVKRHKPSVGNALPSSIDTFGTSVKLPSFSQRNGYHLFGSLDGWSRIKSGKKTTSDEQSKRVEKSPHPIPIHSVQGEGLTLSINDGSALEDAAHSPALALCEQDTSTGRHLEPSVEDPPIAQGNSPVGDSAHYATAAEASKGLGKHCGPEIAPEETISWTNPISKEQLLISTRTGLVVPRPSKRPSSVSIDLENSSESGACQNQWPRKRAKITRSLSDPFVTPKEGSWVGDCLRSWENPTFRPAEESIAQVSFEGRTLEASTVLHGRHHRCSQVDIDNAFSESSTSFSAKLSKDGLKSAQVIAQVDKKFILVKMRMDREAVSSGENEASVLVLIDQHAADERVRVEGLLHELCQPPAAIPNSLRSSLGHTSGIATTLLSKPITVQIPTREHTLFKTHAAHFADWGILYDVAPPRTGPSSAESSPTSGITIRTLPPGIAERCRLDPKPLVQLLRAQMWKREASGGVGIKRASTVPELASQPETASPLHTASANDWLHRIGTCPPGILDMLNSRSCRSAIMFNDELGLDDCRALVAKLAACRFPFQCAHGRPSMVPLVELSSVGVGFGVGVGRGGRGGAARADGWGVGEGEVGFVEAWRKWSGRKRGRNVGVGEKEDVEEDGGNE